MNVRLGDRIELTAMPDEEYPIPAGTRGTITRITRHDWPQDEPWMQVQVDWDTSDRTLSLVCPPDEFRVLERRTA